MPSESLPWDRKEVFLKDRKQETIVGSDVIGGGVGVAAGGVGAFSTTRWREPYHGLRDCPRASPRRPLTVHTRYDIGCQQLYAEESSGHGCMPSSPADRFFEEEEIFKPPSGRSGGGRSASGGRESLGSFRRSPFHDSSGDCTLQHHFSPVTAHRSVVVPISYTSFSSSSPIPSKGHLDQSDGGVIDAPGSNQKHYADYSLASLAWKPLKWTRPSSLSLSKAVRFDSEEASLGMSVPQVKVSPSSSPVMSNLQLDDRTPSKKPRLGWGQGLAKYEKQKVVGAVDVSCLDGSVPTTNSCKDFQRDSSPKFSAAPGSSSPTTPSSATCTSSACVGEKLSIKLLNAETDRTQCESSSAIRLHNSPEDISINLDRLDANSISTLDLLLCDLMQPEESCSGDSTTKNSTLNKLLLLKKDISKELEKTECEIDLFENKLKSLDCDMQTNNYPECTYTTQGVAVEQPNLKPVDITKSLLSKLSSSGKCMHGSSTGLEERQVVQTHLSEEHVTEEEDKNCTSFGTEGGSTYSISLQTDECPFNNKDEKTPFLDAEPLVHPAERLLADVCCPELSHCLDQNHIIKSADDSSARLILASNMDAAKRALEEFDMAMPPGIAQFSLWDSDNILQCRKNYMHIRGKLAMKKSMVRFKERFLTLKFRALQHLWREDLNLLTLRRNRPKSNKRSEINSRLPQLTLQKHRSSTRSRHALPACNLTVVPTTEIINFTSKLLSESQLRIYRNNLKMPAQIIDEDDRRYSRFKSNNGLIEDPSAFEKERVMMNPWMQDEKNIFFEMLATLGKDFRKISSFIPHKTTADCVEYYYKNHKTESFTEVKRQLKLRKQWQSRHSNTYLITSGTRFSCDANAASLELLGSASIIEAESNCSKRNNEKRSCKTPRRISGLSEKANSEISGSEKEAAAADVLAGICGALSSDAMSSCITSSVDLPEKVHFATIERSLTPEVPHQTIDEEDTCSDESSDEMESSDWNDEEKSLFIRAFNMYGKDFVKVAHFVRTRSLDQCKIFYSKARKCLGLDVIQPVSTNGVTPTSDVNEGRSGTDDACSMQSWSKMDADFTQSMLKTCSEGHSNPGNAAHQNDADWFCAQCDIDGSIPDEFVGKFDNKSSIFNDDALLIKDEDVVEIFVKTNTNDESACNIFSPGKPFVELNDEDKVKLRISVDAAQRSIKVDSNHLTGLIDPAVENMPPVMIEEGGNYLNVVGQKDDGCPNHVFSSNSEHQKPSDLLCPLPKGPNSEVAKPESAVSDGPNCVLPDSSSVSLNRHDDMEPSIAILNLQDGGKCKEEPISKGLLAQDLLKSPTPNLIDSPLLVDAGASHKPLQSPNNLKMNGKAFDKKSAVDNPIILSGTSPSNCFLIPEISNDKCVGAGTVNSTPVYKSKGHLTENKSSVHQAICLQGDSYTKSEEQSHRVGDLKLFGQILSHPSSQKACSAQQGTKANENADSLASWKDAAIFTCMPGSNNALPHHCHELPQRSYGFWDGTRIQTGFASLPESAITLANYQASSGLSFRTSNTEYQQQAQMPSVCSEKKFVDVFPSDLHKRNGFDVLSGFQQQRKMVQLGVNLVGPGLSDPVAALQMHYSGRRAKVLTGDLESLAGDMGGR